MTDPGPLACRYGEFSRRLHEAALREHLPLSGTFEITSRCNLRCRHCYMPRTSPSGESAGLELGCSEVRGILDDVASAGCLWMLLTGGEPLLREDFPEIYVHAVRLGMIVSLFTNATLVTRDLARLLGRHPPFIVEVTLYGASEETCRQVTGRSGVLADALRGVRALLEQGVRVGLKSTVMRQNLRDLDGMRGIADELGLDFRFDAMLNAGLDGSAGPKRVRLEPREIVELDLSDPRRRESLVEFWKRFGDRDDRDRDLLYSCGAGR
ncbi:radical SAM protein, partial [Candidatus Fermentibacterales bacterium]|nr:radical SAM protein [Candidatus Fermentibacterales bacterium]